MAFKLASLFVEVGAEQSPLNSALAGIRAKLAGLAGMRFNIPGGGFAAMLGLAGAGFEINKAIQGASTLAETIDKTRRIFGDSANAIIKKSNEMAAQFGVSKTEYLNAAAGFGAVFKGIGKSQDEAAALGNKLALLALDMANFDSTSRADAFGAISSALRGEMDPIERFRVFLNEDKIAAEALAMGLAKTKGQIDDTAKKMAIMSLILKQTKDAQGNLADTSSGAFAQNQKFWGSLENLGQTVGTTLLPAFTTLLTLLNEMATDMQASADAGSGAWSSFLGFFSSAIDTAGVVYRNFGDMVEITGISIGGSLLNAWEYLSYGGEVASATGKYIWESLVEAFDLALVAAGNMKDNLITIFQEIWDYVASGFKDPIEIKLKPIMQGMEFKGNGQFVMPQMKALSSVQDQLDEARKRIQEHEDARTKRNSGAAGKAPGAPGQNAAGAPGQPGSSKVGVTDADSYARELQDGALKGEDIQKNILKVNEEQAKTLQEIAKSLLNPKTGKLAIFG